MKKIYPNSFQSKHLNTFQVNVSILYPLKTGKPQVNSGVYSEFVWNEMKNLNCNLVPNLLTENSIL